MNKILTFSLSVLLAAAFIGCGKTEAPENEIPDEDTDIPTLPADPQENSTDFRHRMLLLQHTGSGCGFCPRVIALLKDLSELPDYKDAYSHTAVHAYNPDDKAYTSDAVTLSNLFNSAGFPNLTYNLTVFSAPQKLDDLKKGIDSYRKDAAEIGICAASAVLENKEIIVNVEVKAAVENTYRISVWLLQDGIYSRQTDYDTGVFESWMNTHNNCLMKMAGNGAQTKIYGRNIGNVTAGTKVSGIYRIDVDSSWNLENCKLLILANGKNGEVYDVSNSVVCPVNGSVAYDYNTAE